MPNSYKVTKHALESVMRGAKSFYVFWISYFTVH